MVGLTSHLLDQTSRGRGPICSVAGNMEVKRTRPASTSCFRTEIRKLQCVTGSLLVCVCTLHCPVRDIPFAPSFACNGSRTRVGDFGIG